MTTSNKVNQESQYFFYRDGKIIAEARTLAAAIKLAKKNPDAQILEPLWHQSVESLEKERASERRSERRTRQVMQRKSVKCLLEDEAASVLGGVESECRKVIKDLSYDGPYIRNFGDNQDATLDERSRVHIPYAIEMAFDVREDLVKQSVEWFRKYSEAFSLIASRIENERCNDWRNLELMKQLIEDPEVIKQVERDGKRLSYWGQRLVTKEEYQAEEKEIDADFKKAAEVAGEFLHQADRPNLQNQPA